MAYENLPLFPTCAKSTTTRQKKSKLVHANGLMPIQDLVSYFTEDEHDTAIVVVRHIRCEENQRFQHTQGQPLKWHESLAVKSSTLRQPIADVALCYFDRGDVLKISHEDLDSQMKRMSISPVRLFFFHHQQRLFDYAQTHPHVSEHVLGLNEYCTKKYASDFQRARQLFPQGFVSQKHFEKLYLLISIVIGYENGLTRGYVVSEWPL